MALPELINHALKNIKVGDEKGLNDVYTAIVKNLYTQTTNRVGLGTLIVCAETALKVGNIETARKCIDTYFLESRRYVPSLQPSESRDQYLCRAYYALGLVVGELAKPLKGQALVDGCKEAIKYIQQGLEIAAANPRYIFLVYNGTVHYWHASRPLQRDGLRTHLLPSMSHFVQALEKVPGQEEWKIQLLCSLALCQWESGGKTDEALRTLNRAYDMAAGKSLPQLMREVVGLISHMSPASVLASAKSGQARGTTSGAVSKKGAPSPGPATGSPGPLVAVAPGFSPEEETALRLVQAVLSSKMDAASAEENLKIAVSKVDPQPDGPTKGAKLGVVSRAAWAAALAGLPQLAEKWAGRAAASQELGPRLWSELARIHMTMAANFADAEKLKPPALRAYAKVLDQLEDVVTGFTQLRDVEGVHCTSRLIWNAGLPLMQPTTRRSLKRAFNSAAKALEVISSPLHRLRAALHLEAAQSDILDESLIKAQQEVQKALSLDYMASQEEVNRFQLDRPLDRYLVPLALALALRTGAIEEPDGPEAEAVWLIERSKEAHNPAIKVDLLQKAISILASCPPAEPPATNDKGPNRATAQVAARRRSCLWFELVRSASSGGLDDLVLAAAPHHLAMTWSPAVDSEMVVQQAELAFALAASAVRRLQALKAEIVPPLVFTSVEIGKGGLTASIAELQQLVVNSIRRAMAAGTAVKEPWIIINGAASIFNWYLPLMKANRYAELVEVLEGIVNVLLGLPKTDQDGSLLAASAEAAAYAAEHNYLLAGVLLDKYGNERPFGDVREALGEPPYMLRKGDAEGYQDLTSTRRSVVPLLPLRNNSHQALQMAFEKLATAAAVCEKAFSKVGDAPSQRLYEAYARLQQLRGLGVSVPGGTGGSSEVTSKVVGIIEALSHGLPDRPGYSSAQALADIKSAMAALSSLPSVNVELWAKLARGAAAAGMMAMAQQCATAVTRVLPNGLDPRQVEDPASVSGLDSNTWFWMSVAELIQGQAILALAHPTCQDAATQLSLRRLALEHLAASSRFAAHVQKPDVAEAAARSAWNAALPFMASSVLRTAVVGHLHVIADAMAKTGCSNKEFYVMFNCMLMEAMSAAWKWQPALASIDKALKGTPRTLSKPLLTWRSYLLSQIGENVPEEMSKVFVYKPEMQAHAWCVLAQHSNPRFDQMVGIRKAVDSVAESAWLKAQILAEYAEWLVASGLNDGDNAEDSLLTAVDAILEFDLEDLADKEAAKQEEEEAAAADEGSEEDSEGRAITPSRSKRMPSAKVRPPSRLSRKSSRARSVAQQQNSLMRKRSRVTDNLDDFEDDIPEDTSEPLKLDTTLLEAMVRLFTMLGCVANAAAEQTDYLLTAHHYAVRLLSQAVTSAAEDEHKETGISMREAARLPQTLCGWASWRPHPGTERRMASDNSIDSISHASLSRPPLTIAYLSLLIEQISSRGYHVHCLALYQLQRLVAKFALRDPVCHMCITLSMASLLDNLGLSREAVSWEAEIGDYESVTEADQEALRQAAELHELATCALTSTSRRPRSALTIGRFSLLSSNSMRNRAGSPNSQTQTMTLDAASKAPVSTPGTDSLAPPLPSWLEVAAREPCASAPLPGLTPVLGNVLILRPFTHFDAWLRRGEYLLERGHYESAKKLLMMAEEYARCVDAREGQARALLLLAKCEALANRHSEAILLIQSAQQLGGDVNFWKESIIMYADFRLAQSPEGGVQDARDNLQGGITLFTTLARDDRGAEFVAMSAVATIKLRFAQLMLAEQAKRIKQGLAGGKKFYDQALQLANQGVAALAAREAGLPLVEAMMVQAELMKHDPTPTKDRRTRLKKVLSALVAAEEKASELYGSTTTRDINPRVTMPVARMLARVRLMLAELQFEVCRQRDVHAAADRDKARPSFPKIKGKTAEPVVQYIDDMEIKPFEPNMLPEESAVIYGSSAAQLAGVPVTRAACLLKMGEGLHYKYLATAADDQLPWMMGDALAFISVGKDGPRAAAESYRLQAVSALQEALSTALDGQAWETAEQASYVLANCYGRHDPRQTAQFLAVMQDVRAANGLESLMQTAAPPQHPEILVRRQLQKVQKYIAVPGLSPHFTKPWRALLQAGITAPRTNIAAMPSATEMVQRLPEDVRVVMFTLSPDGSVLYMAIFNLPDAAAMEEAARSTVKGKPGTPLAKKSEVAVVVPKLCLVEQLNINPKEMDSLRRDLRTFRRGAEKKVREAMESRALEMVPQAADEGSLSKEGGPAAAPIPEATSPKGTKGSRRTPSTPSKKPPPPTKGSKTGTRTTPPPADLPLAREFKSEMNETWSDLVMRMEEMFQPLRSTLDQVFVSPAPPALDESGTDSRRRTGPKKGDEEGPKPLRAVLSIDQSLSTLPWESWAALAPHVASISRTPGLAMLHAALEGIAAGAAGSAAAPSFELSSAAYIVDPKLEMSSPEPPSSRHGLSLALAFKNGVQASVGKDWKGVVGNPGKSPGEPEYQDLISTSSCMLYFGPGRFLSYIGTKLVASSDLRGCEVAIIIDRVNSTPINEKQVTADNRKTKAERRVESPAATAELLLARGVKTVVVTTAVSTPVANNAMLNALMTNLAGGMPVAEAVWKAGQTLDPEIYELHHLRSNFVVYGVPHVVANNASKAAKKK